MAQELIRVEQLAKEFYLDGDTIRVLEGINLSVNVGERLAICGESGAGKSTLLQIMGALDQPTSGNLLFSGDNVFSWSQEKLAGWRNARVGFVFQFHHLLPEFTALENVMIPSLIRGDSRKTADISARNILTRVGLWHWPGLWFLIPHWCWLMNRRETLIVKTVWKWRTCCLN